MLCAWRAAMGAALAFLLFDFAFLVPFRLFLVNGLFSGTGLAGQAIMSFDSDDCLFDSLGKPEVFEFWVFAHPTTYLVVCMLYKLYSSRESLFINMCNG